MTTVNDNSQQFDFSLFLCRFVLFEFIICLLSAFCCDVFLLLRRCFRMVGCLYFCSCYMFWIDKVHPLHEGTSNHPCSNHCKRMADRIACKRRPQIELLLLSVAKKVMTPSVCPCGVRVCTCMRAHSCTHAGTCTVHRTCTCADVCVRPVRTYAQVRVRACTYGYICHMRTAAYVRVRTRAYTCYVYAPRVRLRTRM
jgi:hypothetical protein